MKFIKETLIDSDFLVIVEEVGNKESFDESLVKKLNSFKIPIILLINKIDLSSQQELEESISHWKSIFPNVDIYPVSAIEGFFIDELIEIFKDKLPLSPPFFPKDQFTDRPERFFVNESIREQILIHYDKEVPYSVEVITEDFKESPKIIKIRSLILVERDSQKGILIGHKGSSLKRVASEARINLEKFFGKKIFLEVFVKVRKNWRNDPSSLKKFGYNL